MDFKQSLIKWEIFFRSFAIKSSNNSSAMFCAYKHIVFAIYREKSSTIEDFDTVLLQK